MKFVVPLTMPMMRRTGSPASDSRSARTSGMPPATAASKRRSHPAASAALNTSAPTLASSSLFAVTTGLPCLSAVRISSRAGSMPPMTSTMRSIVGSSTTSAASRVSRPSGIGTARSRERLRTATRATESDSPVRASIDAARSSMSPTSGPPTLPQPRMPMRTVSLIARSRYRARSRRPDAFSPGDCAGVRRCARTRGGSRPRRRPRAGRR